MLRSSAAGQVARALGRRALSTTEASGIKVASHDDGRLVSELSLVVRAGSRFEPSPGVAHLLSKFAFRDTAGKSGLRFARESELLGGQFGSNLGREYLVLNTKFLREDLPYFVEELAQVSTNTLFRQYEFDEEVVPLAKLEEAKFRSDAIYQAEEAVHEVAYRSGLGNPLLAIPSSPVTLDQIKQFAASAYTKGNVSLFAKGVNHSDLEKFVGDSAFSSLAAGEALKSPASGAFGGEARIKSAGPVQVAVLAFPTTTKPCLTALKHILQRRSLKWSSGNGLLDEVAAKTGTTIKIRNYTYGDSSLFGVVVYGASAEGVAAATKESAAVIKSIATKGPEKERVQRALARGKLKAADKIEPALAPAVDLSKVTPDTVKAKANALVTGKVALAVVGKTHLLPHVDELF